MSVKVLAQRFDADALLQIARQAEHNASLITQGEPKPWRRATEQNDAADTFNQLAAYARRVVKMQSDA